MNLTLRIGIGDGPIDVTTNLYVMVQYERKYKRKASDMANGIGVEDMLYLAYESCKLHNIVVPVAFDDFVKKCQTLEVIGNQDENPTHEAPTDIS